jgi:phosphoglucomutase
MGVDVFTVPEQREPDGNFSTVDFPNPEIAPAMDLALRYAAERKADIVLGTDPDADRLGIAVPDRNGYRLISGNQLGAMLADYLFLSYSENGTLPENPAFINTIVTSDLQNAIAESRGASSFKVLTGFKYIGELIKKWEQDGSYNYVFGGEESYGFLAGTEVRDKDAVSAAVLTVEMTLWNVMQGRSVLDYLNTLYVRHGYYQEILISKYFKGESGLKVMGDLMTSLRTDFPEEFGGSPVSEIRDYQDGTTCRMPGRAKKKNISLPSSNVVQFVTGDGSIITVRPSGTEPKIKFYASCRAPEGTPLDKAEKLVGVKISKIEEKIENMIP